MTRLRLAVAFSVLVLAFAVVDRVRDDFFARAPEDAPRGTDFDPVSAARLFLDAVHRQDCARAFELFSTATQKRIAAELALEVQRDPSVAGYRSLETFHCAVYDPLVSGTVALRSREGDRAIVDVSYREATDFLIPGFFPTSHRLVPSELVLVREGPAWRVERPAPGSPGWREHGSR